MLGSATPYPAAGNPCSGYLVEGGGVRVWVDAGSGTLGELRRYVGLDELDAVWISHLHADHSADLLTAYYGLLYADVRRDAPLPLFGPPGIADRLAGFLTNGPTRSPIESAFDVVELFDGHRVRVGGLTLLSRRVEHGGLDAFGLRIDGSEAADARDARVASDALDVCAANSGGAGSARGAWGAWGAGSEGDDGSDDRDASDGRDGRDGRGCRGGDAMGERGDGAPGDGVGAEGDPVSLVYSGDSAPCFSLVELALGCQLFLCEADGAGDGHHSPEEAGRTAAEAGVGRLLVTHVGPPIDPEEAVRRAATVFDGPVEYAGPGRTFTVTRRSRTRERTTTSPASSR
ncbi:MBL fold metallo-hydrolase [Streptomyces sp. NPDC101191]|uniref:MBL fold metallo-hydrolase n=1 Tax=Streptomyces sp. NPDC101191 TaxID=3366126 RepID=UPI00382C2A8F